MNNRHWERGDGAPFVAWLVFDTTVTLGERGARYQKPAAERLPYTAEMLLRRADGGGDLPSFVQIIEGGAVEQ